MSDPDYTTVDPGDASIEAHFVKSLSLNEAAIPCAIQVIPPKSNGIRRGFFDTRKTKPMPVSSQEEIDFLIRIYHEAPNDVLELILSQTSGWLGKAGGGLNIFRLVNKRIKELVENCCNRVLWKAEHAPAPISSFPSKLFERTTRLKLLSCDSPNLERLDGLPRSLQELHIMGQGVSSLDPLTTSCPNLNQVLISLGRSLTDASPLRRCRNLKHLFVMNSRITDLSFLSHLPNLEHLGLAANNEETPLTNDDLTHISHCVNLRGLGLCNHPQISDVSFIAQCTRLKDIAISNCEEVVDISSVSCCPDLIKLDITSSSVMDLSPLRGHSKLTRLKAYQMLKGFSVHDLVNCPSLTEIHLTDGTEGVDELKQKLGDKIRVCYDHDEE